MAAAGHDLIEIKGGSLTSFSPSVRIMVQEGDRESAGGASARGAPQSTSRGSGIGSRGEDHPGGSRLFSLTASKASRVSGAHSVISKPTATSRTSNLLRFAEDTGGEGGGAPLKPSKSKVSLGTISGRAGQSRSLGSMDSTNFEDKFIQRLTRAGRLRDLERLRRRSLHSLGSAVTGLGEDGGGEGGSGGANGGNAGNGAKDGESGCRPGPGPGGDCASAEGPYDGLDDRPWPEDGYRLSQERERIPECLAKLLRELPDPRELAPLVRSVVISAIEPSRQELHFKSTTKVKRVGLLPVIQVIRAGGMRVGRSKEEKGPPKLMATYQLEPKEVPCWRRARQLVQETLADGLTGVPYSSQLCMKGCRVIAAVILQRLKKFNFERYRLATQVRIAQRLHQGMAMDVACLWDERVDRFSYAQFENATLSAQVILFLVYRD